MARTGYRWYKIADDKLVSLVHGKDQDNHIIQPARCYGDEKCRYPGLAPGNTTDLYSYGGTSRWVEDPDTARWWEMHEGAVALEPATPPTRNHRCGYYAYYRMPDAMLKDHRHHTWDGAAALMEVVAWGRMQLHQAGFRAERIALKSVFVSGPLDERIADLYQCNKRDWAEALAMLTEHEVMMLDRIMTIWVKE